MSSLFTASQCNISGVQIKNQKELSFHILKSHRVFEMYQIHPTVSEEIITCPESVCKDKVKYFQINGALAFRTHRFFECKNKDKNALHFLSQIKLIKASHHNLNDIQQEKRNPCKIRMTWTLEPLHVFSSSESEDELFVNFSNKEKHGVNKNAKNPMATIQ